MSDLIDRQAAIDAIEKRLRELREIDSEWAMNAYNGALECLGLIKHLPSAQPEIIRCTECKHYREYDSEYVENAVVVQCMADRYPISETIPDGWFCAGAERRSDD